MPQREQINVAIEKRENRKLGSGHGKGSNKRGRIEPVIV